MFRRLISAIERLRGWLHRINNKRPMATDVVNDYVIVVYHHQKINLKKSELPAFAGMSRGDKRAMALRFKNLEKKGLVKFIKIDGKTVCVRNLDYLKRKEYN